MASRTETIDNRISQQKPKKSNRIVVAQISDLHLTLKSKTEQGRWKALRDSLESKKDEIDILVVTGDLIELPWQWWKREEAFESAKKYLEKLCESTKLDAAESLLVLPGNHDVRMRGFGGFKAQAHELFANVFSQYWLPYRLFPELKLCLFLFDSNPHRGGIKPPDLAAGYVEPDRLIEFKQNIRTLAEEYCDQWLEATRVTLLHHHPMPIAGTEQNPDKLIGGEPYMLLKNSGTFLEESVRASVNLILHGHKHYPAISRATFHVANHFDHPIPVVGAGSVGEDDDHPLSYNLLTFRDSGVIELQRLRRKPASYVEEFGEPLCLVSYEDARQGRIPRLAQQVAAKLRIQSLHDHHDIQPVSGDVRIHWRVEGAAPIGERAVESLPRRFSSKTGYFHKPVYEPTDPDQSISLEWNDDLPTGEIAKGKIIYKPPVSDGRPLTYKAKVEMNNAFHFNKQERLDATNGKEDMESVSATLGQLCDYLTLSVSFPAGCFPEGGFQVEACPFPPDPESKPERDPRESEHAHNFFENDVCKSHRGSFSP